mmetsp:Transcript_4574/g.6114  ORF Transcript_4574/g.6114 Transcript_4574/m.6114 type:complete len:473 (-) Transcript_4574:35-1453(-)
MDFGRRETDTPNRMGLNMRHYAPPNPDLSVPTFTMYSLPPSDGLMSLDEFELLPIERLKVMSIVENAASRGMKFHDLTAKVEQSIKNTHLDLSDKENRRKDNISHWVLRLAFSKSEDLRRRFLQFECLLFKHRFEKQTRQQIKQFMLEQHSLGKVYTPISNSERDQHFEELKSVYVSQNKYNKDAMKMERMKWYKVHWTDVTDLVAKRSVFVHGGMAFVPHTQLVTILHSRFRMNLSKNLAIGHKTLPVVAQDDRIGPVLKKLQNAYLGPDFSNANMKKGDKLRPELIDAIAPVSFPLCMRSCHSALKNKHHLQYHGRVQFRLFLKGCGLTMNDALQYFQKEFCKKAGMSPEEFVKRYSYNIRHAYGQEGKRKSYTPYNCVHLILGNQPTGGQSHGCVFKSHDTSQIKYILQQQKTRLASDDIDFILEPLKTKDYQVACRRHFERSHKGSDSENVGNHPNAWYEASVAFNKK